MLTSAVSDSKEDKQPLLALLCEFAGLQLTRADLAGPKGSYLGQSIFLEIVRLCSYTLVCETPEPHNCKGCPHT